MDKVEITSTSRHSAICSDLVIRDGDTVRFVFRPEIVDNPANPTACVRGRFLYQRKGKNDAWEDIDAQPLSTLKKGEGFQLEIKAGELRGLLRDLGALYRAHGTHGVPQGRIEFVRLGQHLANLLQLTQPDLDSFLSDNRADAIKTLQRVLRWLATTPNSAAQLINDDSELPILNALVGLANLRAVEAIWKTNSHVDDEEFWQQVFAKHSFVLSQMFAFPVIVIRGKAYVGGKRLDNTHGNIVDFLGRIRTSGEAVLIEIKTPKTPLLGSIYRQVYPTSRDLSGAISQVLQYRETIVQETHALSRTEGMGFTAADPRSMVIAGCAEHELTDEAKLRSFERFRERLSGVTVVTFDEVFQRVSDLIGLLQQTSLTEPPADR